jgi:hypothetical protein
MTIRKKDTKKHSWVDVNRTRDPCKPCHLANSATTANLQTLHPIPDYPYLSTQKSLVRLIYPSVIWNIFLMECILFMCAAFLKIWKMKYEIWNMKYEIWNMKYEIWNMKYEIWNMKYEIWNMKYEIFKYEIFKYSNMQICKYANVQYEIRNTKYSNMKYVNMKYINMIGTQLWPVWLRRCSRWSLWRPRAWLLRPRPSKPPAKTADVKLSILESSICKVGTTFSVWYSSHSDTQTMYHRMIFSMLWWSLCLQSSRRWTFATQDVNLVLFHNFH